MEWFKTKKEFLVALWKNPTDNKLVDRMLTRWEAYIENGMYFIADKDARIKALEKEVEELKKQNKVKMPDTDKVEIPSKQVAIDNDLLDHLALMYSYVEMKNEFINRVVKSYYEKFSWQYDWDWAVEKVYKMYQYNPDVAEKEEIDYVKSLVTQ